MTGSPLVPHPDAPAGRATKYARIERERRFLLSAPPPGPATWRVRIEDRYLSGTRLRLRRMTDLATGDVVRKLTQKVPAPDGAPGLITTVYLSEAEYGALAAIPAAVLAKVRSSVPPFGVDAFEGPLAGLVLAEAEFDEATAEASFPVPAWSVAEVTRDPRFTGGRLASTTPEELRELLATFGIGV